MAEKTPTEEVLEIPIEKIRVFKGQPRKYFNQDSLRRLARCMTGRAGQTTPVHVRRLKREEQKPGEDGQTLVEYELVDGQRRYAAAILGKLPTLTAILKHPKDSKEQWFQSAITNLGREGHTAEEYMAVVKFCRDEYKMGVTETAETLTCSPTLVSQHLSLLELHEDLIVHLGTTLEKGNRFSLQTAVLMASLPKDQQLEIASEILGKGYSHARMAHEIKVRAHHMGLEVGVRKRSPSQEHDILTRRLDQVVETLNLHLHKPAGFYWQMYGVKGANKDQDLRQLAAIENEARQLREKIEGDEYSPRPEPVVEQKKRIRNRKPTK